MKKVRDNMKLFEFTASWAKDKGMQVAYAYCNAQSKAHAQRLIHTSVPFAIDLGDVKVYPYSSAKDKGITLWYFDESGTEHHDKYRRIDM